MQLLNTTLVCLNAALQHVAQYLVNHGVSADRFIGIANGDTKPVASNATAAGKS